ncbi:hypothetical protein ISF_03359 [Cordyceps fumosorosea ARSEF 2679]|uniref:Uncharacterized protein n=1 Tax=Cordyceps fumosorosea (strain ARSEF 2679) TaxID=1081104 RepID=A0A162LDB2_CORFA|nr:hypothetical protein ISF_03359 [Cordyceps fumosorosea ARSEF 2679]OAA68984.1 hypothetical protein ISF_03359 [Cordyceps fumosorosea ARSEF 2679]
MALLNPIYVLFVPVLFLVTVPMALFAGITTTLAFSLLICRGILVYLDLALSYLHRGLHGLQVPARLHRAAAARSDPPSPTSSYLALRRRRHRRSSNASVLSVGGGSVTPVHDIGLGLTPSVGPERDYEGLGGWRVGDDDIWTTINSRLELPDSRYPRHHHRSPSGGGASTPGEGGFLMMKRRTRSPEIKTMKASLSPGPASPNSSRTRTPSTSRLGFSPSLSQEGYFSLIMSPQMASKMASNKSAAQQHYS